MFNAEANTSGKFYIRSNQTISGPHSLGELTRLYLAGSITGETEQRPQESDEWAPLEKLYDRMFPSWR